MIYSRLSDPVAKYLQSLFRIAALLLVLVLLWNKRFELYPDGISYLDVADSFMQTGWHGLVHSYWSPLYPVLLAVMKFVVHPAPYWLIPTMQIMNLALFFLLLASFDLFISELVVFTKTVSGNDGHHNWLPEWVVVSIGYSLFIWSCLSLAEIWKQTPDPIIAICVYLVSYFIVKNKIKPIGMKGWFVVGLIFGVGFLAKSIMLLLEIVYILMLLICSRQNIVKTISMILMILLASGIFILPFVISLSLKQGHFTIGDNGKLNYAWYVNGVTQFAHWQGQCPNRRLGKQSNQCPEIGKPVHPTRRMHSFSEIFEFDEPIGGTYSPWFDPVYWHEGVTPYFDLQGHFWALKQWKAEDKETFLFGMSGGLFILLAFVILIYVGGDLRSYFRKLVSVLDLLIPPSVILFIAYFVNFNTRYVGHFVVLVWLLLMLPVAVVPSREMIRLLKVLVVLVVFIPVNAGIFIMRDFANEIKTKPLYTHFLVANYFNSNGIKPGSKVVHFGNSWWAAWAKLSGVRIIAEISSQKGVQGPFWNLSKERMDHVIETISKNTKAKIIVAQKAPDKKAKILGWRNIPKTTYYVYDLQK